MPEDKDDDEISSLKQTLDTQQKLVHELYLELEAEREASCTAANEALSMILRLQREKAADKLEAIQFKRMTQEDLNHAHQTILLFQETLHHKDMFMASLDYQLQAYRNQMLAMGLTDSQIRDLELLPQQNNGDHLPRAIQSTPDSPHAWDHEFEFHGKDLNTVFEESAPSHLKLSYWDTRVRRGLSPGGEVIKEPHSTAFAFPVAHPAARGANVIELDLPCSSYQASDPENLLQSNYTSEAQNSATIHDVFEVPPPYKDDGSPALRENYRLQNPGIVPHGNGTTKYCCQKSAYDEIKSGERVNVNCHLALMDLANGIFPFRNDLRRLKRRLDKLEGERGASGSEEEELGLLREIHEKLSTVQSEMRTGRAKHTVMDESSLISLMENLFFYSL